MTTSCRTKLGYSSPSGQSRFSPGNFWKNWGFFSLRLLRRSPWRQRLKKNRFSGELSREKVSKGEVFAGSLLIGDNCLAFEFPHAVCRLIQNGFWTTLVFFIVELEQADGGPFTEVAR
jgi:hypothetical protein